MKFTQLNQSLQEGLGAIYLIQGEETYFRDHAVEAIRAACRLVQPALNDARAEGAELKGEALSAFRDSLYTLPFLDERRIVRVYDFYPTEREWESVMSAYADAPCPTTVLLIVNGGAKQGACDLKRKRSVTYVDCSRADEETLTRWLFGVLRREGLTADTDVCGMIVSYCASNAARIRREAQKLRLLLGEGGRVTREIVEEHIERDAEYKIYELTQAASRKNFTRFHEILEDLLEKGMDENALLASLASHFKTLHETSVMKGSDEEVGKILGLKPYAVKKDRELAAKPDARTEELYRTIYALGCALRCGDKTKSGALFCALGEIFFGNLQKSRETNENPLQNF